MIFIKSYKICIIFVLKLIYLFKQTICDCGLPAIPYNAQIDRVRHVYYESETVTYQCQLEYLKMVGNFSRQCLNSRWVGSIPKCVEELNFGIISAINLADKNNHSLKYEDGWVNRDPVAAYYVDYKRDKCLRSTTMSRPHSWKLHLAKEKRHISYIEVVIKDTGNRFDNLDASKIIKYARVNELRECVASVVDTTDATKRLALNCLMEFDGDSNWEAWERDKTQVIDIQFDVNDISICEIRLYTNSFMPFHRCGSADIVMYSTMEFIKSGNKYSGNSYYKYQCDEGFQLEGSDDVRCGLNNNWLDPFPVCKPKAMCPYPPDMNGALSVGIKTEHLYSYDGNVSALAGSVIYYQCVGDNGNHSIMIGDSVRLCGINGNWSGVSPVCIHDSELNSDHFNDIKQSDQNYKHMTTIEMFANLTKIANQTALACGIPAMPLFAKPTTAKRYRMFGGQADLRRWYDNGTVLTYQCESAYRWVSGDVDQRTCINGKWIGNVGKCAVNWGNKVKLDVIYVYDLDNKGQWTNQHLVMSTNSTSAWDEHFAYRRDPDKGECATFTVDSKHRWSLRLNETTFITYFVVMLHPGGFFGAKRKISDPKILAKSPVTASVERTDCVLTSVWDYTHSKIGTFFFFTCDMKEPKYRSKKTARKVDLFIDPKKFDTNYKTTNISLCSLAVMVSKDDCGTPDVPLHSTVQPNGKDWIYTCDAGYKLVGPTKVTCGRNGRWSDDFPSCEKVELCPMDKPSKPNFLYMQTRWDNVVQKDQKLVAIIDSLINHSCIATSKKLLVGSQLRICTSSGQWSGTEPYCLDPQELPKPLATKSSSTLSIFMSIISTIVVIALVAALLYYVLKMGYLRQVSIPKLTIPKINIQRPSTIRRQTESPGYGNEGTVAENNSHLSDSSTAPQQHQQQQQPLPKQRLTKINEHLPVFSKGTEFLVEAEDED